MKYLPPEKELDRTSKKFSDRIRVYFHDLIERIESFYETCLRWTMQHRKTIVIGIVLFSALSMGLYAFIGTEFFPDQDESRFTASFKLPVGSRYEETDSVARQMEKIILASVPETQVLVTDVGITTNTKTAAGIGGGGNSGSHAGNIQVGLVPSEDRHRSVFEIAADVRRKLAKMPGVQVFLNPGGILRYLLNFGSNAPIDVEIRGFDLETGSALAREIFQIVRSTQGAVDVQISRDDNLPELHINIDRDKAGVLGIDVAGISNTIYTCMAGTVASLYTDPISGNQYNILVRLNQDYRDQIEDLKQLTITTANGQQVLLGNIATIEKRSGPVQIDRKYQQRLVEVTANVSGRDLGSVAKDIQDKLDQLKVPQGFEIKQTGNVEQQKKTFSDLSLAFLLAIVLVYVVMASQFQSFIDPFIIMFTVPLGIAGVLWMLFLTHTTLSVTSFQGVIVMVGIVVSNGILLVDYTNHQRLSGLELHEAVIRGGKTRLKPILMTSIATVLGLIPMAIGLGGESTQAPLAIAVIGGLTFSTVLTLFFVPILYTIFEERFKREIHKDEVESTKTLEPSSDMEQPASKPDTSTQRRKKSSDDS
jgi:multidrug efflux pump subunit AcrB